MRIALRWGAAVLLGAVCLHGSALAQTEEYMLKAAYLEHFTRFIDWPEGSDVLDLSRPFVLGIIGDNPFGPVLADIYADHMIKNKRVEIRNLSDPAGVSECHLLFIAKSEQERLPDILAMTRSKPILTVGDSKGFAEQGVLINLFLEANKVRFEINESAAIRSGLKFSHLILRLARIVNPRGGLG